MTLIQQAACQDIEMVLVTDFKYFFSDLRKKLLRKKTIKNKVLPTLAVFFCHERKKISKKR